MPRQCLLSSVLTLIFLIIFSGCSTHSDVYANSDTLDLEHQDLSSLAESSAEKFLEDYKPQGKKKHTLAIEKAENETGQKIDLELFGRKFARVIRKSDRYFLSVSMGASRGEMVNKVRKIRNDEEYNEDQKIEKGELMTPDLSLKIKIKKGDVEFHDGIGTVRYIILLSVEDLKQGIVLWDTEDIVTKSADVTQYLENKNTHRKQEVALSQEEETEAKNKKNQLLFEARVGIGQRNTPILTTGDSKDFAYSIGAKVGIIHRWSSRYAIAFYGEYEASFQPYDIPTRYGYTSSDKDLTTHSIGIGTRLEMSFFYLSAGALYDTREFNSNFFKDGYNNVNPYVGTGFILGTSTFGFIIGARYVLSLGNGMYLNKGVSADLGLYVSL